MFGTCGESHWSTSSGMSIFHCECSYVETLLVLCVDLVDGCFTTIGMCHNISAVAFPCERVH